MELGSCALGFALARSLCYTRPLTVTIGATSRLRTLTSGPVRSARPNSGITAASLLGLYLLSIGHAVLVPHVFCEHGELIHTLPLAQSRLAKRTFDGHGLRIASATQSADLTAREGDAHCLVCANPRKQLSESKGCFEPCRPLIDVRHPESAGIPPARLLVLQLAPKHSPPA